MSKCRDPDPYKNRIPKAIGTQQLVTPDVDHIEEEHGNIFFLCSDGLTDHLSDHEIKAILQTCDCIEKASNRLVDAAKAKGGKDNITIAMIKVLNKNS